MAPPCHPSTCSPRWLSGYHREGQEPRREYGNLTDSPDLGCSLLQPGGWRPCTGCPWCLRHHTWCEQHIRQAPWASTWHHMSHRSGRHTQSSPGRGLQWQTLGDGVRRTPGYMEERTYSMLLPTHSLKPKHQSDDCNLFVSLSHETKLTDSPLEAEGLDFILCFLFFFFFFNII